MSTTDDAKAIIDGLKGVTPGRWCQFSPQYCPEAKYAPMIEWDTSHHVSAVHDGHRVRVAEFTHAADAAHMDRCSPDKIGPICTRLLELEAENERLRTALDQTTKTCVAQIESDIAREHKRDRDSRGRRTALNGGKHE